MTETVPLANYAIAYAILFYFAFLVFFGGLALRIWHGLQRRPKLAAAPLAGNNFDLTLRVGAEVVLLRSTFFADLWAWIFAACVHFGFLLVVIRHLRYALDPSWTGPLWAIVVLAQPLGIYGGMLYMVGVLGFWLRRLLVPELRRNSHSSDYLILLLMLVIPAFGYWNAYVHTDAIAVKDFFVGLAKLQIRPLPSDPLLLIHLWLVAVFLVALPFSKLLHLPRVFAPDSGLARILHLTRLVTVDQYGIQMGSRLRLLMVCVIGVMLLVPAGLAGRDIVQEGWTRGQPDFAKLAKVHKNLDQTVMVRNHPSFLTHSRSMVVYQGKRVVGDSIEKCVACHVVKDAVGQPVGYDSPDHFCRGCHYRAAVSIDCFECHNSKPPAEKQAALATPQIAATLRSPNP